jgi:hypothetical protein
MVDASHANSSKKPENQPIVMTDIAERGSPIHTISMPLLYQATQVKVGENHDAVRLRGWRGS